MTRLIGLWGFAGCGKDTAAEALVADGWRREAFADRLRAMLYALDPIVEVDAEWGEQRLRYLVNLTGWDTAKREYPEIRELLQRLGTEAGRGVLGENVWVDALMRSYWEHELPTVVTDMRFPNEADAIRAAGGITVAIYRPGCEPVNGHSSETALADWPFDFTVHNTGDVGDLHAVMRAIAVYVGVGLESPSRVDPRRANSVDTADKEENS